MASQVARIFFIDQKIRTTGKVTVKDIMMDGNVSEITAKRDIEALRYRLYAPIEYNHKLRAYTYIKEFKLLDFAGEQLFLFYILARGIAKNQNYLPLTAEYSREIITKKIKEILPEEYSELSDNFLYVNSDYETVDFTLLKTILSGMYNRKKLTLDYFTKSRNLSNRNIEPIKVICYGTKWYLAAYCYSRKSIRIFSLSRIDSLELLEEDFEQNDLSAEVDKLINESFGIAKADEVKTAVIKFYEPSSFYVKNQIWHKDQQIKEYNEDGKKIIELTLSYGMPEELIGKVLKYGVNVEIVTPNSLRNIWLSEIKKMYEKWG